MHKLILKTFHELWLAPPDAAAAAPPPGSGAELSEEVCGARCDMLLGVVARSGVGPAGAQRCEWLSSLLAKLLSPSDDDNADAKNPAALAREQAAAVRVCTQIVGELANRLVQLEEEDETAVKPEGMGNVLHVLSLFCASRPELLLVHVDVLAHFLKHEHAVKAVQHTCEMMPKLLRIIDHPPRLLLSNLEKYLSALVFRVPESLLQYAIPALTMTITASQNASLLTSILAKFYKYLTRFDSCARRARYALDSAARSGVGMMSSISY